MVTGALMPLVRRHFPGSLANLADMGIDAAGKQQHCGEQHHA